MIEPTDEMLAAFQDAWDRENRIINDCPGEYFESGARDRAGLAAVLAIVARDYVVQPQRCPSLGTRFQCMRQAGHDGAHSGRLGGIEASWS